MSAPPPAAPPCACRPTATWCPVAQRLRAEIHRAVDLQIVSRRGAATQAARELYAKNVAELQEHLRAAGKLPRGHARGCCCLPCRQGRAVAALGRRAERETPARRSPQPNRWRAKPKLPAPPASPQVEAELARLLEHHRAERERQAALLARDVRDAVRPLRAISPEPPPATPKPQPPAQTPAAAYRAARALGGIVREPDPRGRS